MAAGLVLWAPLAFMAARPELVTLGQQVVPESPVPFASFAGRFRSFTIAKDARPGPLPHIFRLTYPVDWLDGKRESSRPLAVFIDDRKAIWLTEEPSFDQPGPPRVYAYLREPKSQSFFVGCPPATGCDRVDIVRDDATTRFALAWASRGLIGPSLARVALALALLAVFAWLLLRRLSDGLLGGVLALEVWIAMNSDAGQGQIPVLISVVASGGALLLTTLLSFIPIRTSR